MATLLIRNLNDSVKAALRKRAAANGRSMEEEARAILTGEIRRESSRQSPGLGTRLAAIFEGVGPLELLPRDQYTMSKPPFITDEEWGQ